MLSKGFSLAFYFLPMSLAPLPLHPYYQRSPAGTMATTDDYRPHSAGSARPSASGAGGRSSWSFLQYADGGPLPLALWFFVRTTRVHSITDIVWNSVVPCFCDPCHQVVREQSPLPITDVVGITGMAVLHGPIGT